MHLTTTGDQVSATPGERTRRSNKPLQLADPRRHGPCMRTARANAARI